MAFEPKFTITNRLLNNIARIHTLVTEMNNRHFPDVVLVEFEKNANALSSFSSTSIEGNPLPLTEVKRVLKHHPKNARDSETEVLNYSTALEMLNGLLGNKQGNLTLSLILRIQKQITKELLPSSHCGHLREIPVVVNDPLSGQVVFIPPDAKDVTDLLQQLLNFIKSSVDEIDPIILAGIFHKQFVLIHPFIDGNGRTTRLSTKVLLAKMGINTFKLFSFENYYNQNVTKYFKTVSEFGDYYELAPNIDFTAWLEYFTDGIIDELLRVEKQLPASLMPETSLNEYHQLIIEIIKENGFATDNLYAQQTNRAKSTRNLDFQKLITLGLIEKRGSGKASYYVLTGM